MVTSASLLWGACEREMSVLVVSVLVILTVPNLFARDTPLSTMGIIALHAASQVAIVTFPIIALHATSREYVVICSISTMATAKSTNDSIPEEWPTSSKQYDLIGKIGAGAFATVYRANTDDGRPVAVKVLNLDHVDTNLAEIRLEVQAMRLSSHENVLCCHTAFVHEIHLWLVTQLMRKGSSLHCLQTARRILRDKGQTCLMEPHIFYILHETLLGLKYIHDNNTLHRDIKVRHGRVSR
jgi:hypothetical protein